MNPELILGNTQNTVNEGGGASGGNVQRKVYAKTVSKTFSTSNLSTPYQSPRISKVFSRGNVKERTAQFSRQTSPHMASHDSKLFYKAKTSGFGAGASKDKVPIKSANSAKKCDEHNE